MAHNILVKLTGHGYEVTATIGPFERQPTDRQVINARASAEQMFNDVTGRPVMTAVAHDVTAGDEQPVNG